MYAMWWRVASNVSRSAAVAFANVTPTEAASTSAHFRNGSPIAARLAGNDPGALFQKCRVNPRRCFVEMQGRLLVKKRREVLAPRRELRNVMLRSEAPASSAQDETPSINPGQEVRNSYRALRLSHTRGLAEASSVTATGCSITSEATVSAAGATGCFIFRATFFTGAGLGLGLALATARFAVLAILRVLLRLAEFALRSLARPCTFDRFLRLAMITPFGLREDTTVHVAASYQTRVINRSRLESAQDARSAMRYDVVRQHAGSSSEVIVRDMMDARSLA